MKQLVTWLKEQGVERIGEVDRELLEAYKLELIEASDLEVASVNGHIRALKRLFNVMEEFEIVEKNPARYVRRLREEDVIPQTLSDEECLALLGAFDKRTFEGLRNHMLIVTLLATGMRSGEARQLQVGYLDTRDRIIHVPASITKTRRSRDIPYDGAYAAKISYYLRRRAAWLKQAGWSDSPWLFPSLTRGQALSSSGVYHQVVRPAFAEAGVSVDGRKAGPHLLRHTFAHRYLLASRDIRTLQLILGHRSITTTEIYTRLLSDELQHQYDQVRPLAQLLGQGGR
ncbi:tyrosine-type recombinase/integrase [Limnochorda pilosa]|uniref:tyrosine-type recombinase/integrase n=1 Tax=Limnochorda pilosa TaxID=1555112 RepID=UPI001E414D23